MIKYAKVIDTDTGLCEVGLGSNVPFYLSIGLRELDVKQSDIDGKWYLAEKCPMKTLEQLKQEEHERIQQLSMTRSDFFDGTIKAFGVDQDELLPAIIAVLDTLDVTDIEKKVAINNYKNALNFYRKHPLFIMLSDVDIPIDTDRTILISEEQWDSFFDETDKGNVDAYKALLVNVDGLLDNPLTGE